MQFTLFHAVGIWFGIVLVLLVFAARAERRFVWTAAGVAAIIVSGVPALYIAWGLISFLISGVDMPYSDRPLRLSDLSLLEWAVISLPWIPTLTGVWLLVWRWRKAANNRDQ